jgi:hypothetical protein
LQRNTHTTRWWMRSPLIDPSLLET